MSVDVSTCIVAWNAAADLERCLPALEVAAGGLTQEVLVVDNGSTDRTAEVLHAHSEVEVIRNACNPGITPARNQAIARAAGRAILMLDADTIPEPGSIELLVGYLDEHPEVGLVGAKLLNVDGSIQESCRRVPTPGLPFLRRPPLSRWAEHRATVNRHLMREYDHAHPRAVDWVLGACQCYRGELREKLPGGYDERIFSHGGEDTDWCLRIWKAGYEVHYVPEARIVHAYGHFTRKNPLTKQSLRAFTDYYYMLRKHCDARGGYARP
ncbi:MAG: glycosyltransferase [Egibacteraceae bacterium]